MSQPSSTVKRDHSYGLPSWWNELKDHDDGSQPNHEDDFFDEIIPYTAVAPAPQCDNNQGATVAGAEEEEDSSSIVAKKQDEESQDNEEASHKRQQLDQPLPYNGNNHKSSKDGSSDSDDDFMQDVDSDSVLARIEDLLVQQLLQPLDVFKPPSFGSRTFLHATHCRSITSVWLVASFVHELLHSKRTTTTREVYYYYVTHFRNQAECDKAIWDLASLLNVSRSSLGLAASPKGWCCGSLELYRTDTGELMWDGRQLDLQGMPITLSMKQAHVESDAKCILVVEKEGVYNRLSEDQLYLQYPCIIVTGKGFPDVATRLWVQHLQQTLKLPAYGLCDYNPYGISVLNSFQYKQKHPTTNGRSINGHYRRPALDLQWMGLRPSQLEDLRLPGTVFQRQTELDSNRLSRLLQETHPFHQNSSARVDELELLQEKGHKVELEALNWKGMDFLGTWVYNLLLKYEQAVLEGNEELVSKLII